MNNMVYVNGLAVEIPETPVLLIDFLRQQQHLTGTKAPCREGDCGACQVLLRRRGEAGFQAVVSCLLPVQHLADAQVLTIEGVPHHNPVQQAFSAAGASQCGFCSPGLVMAAIHWLLSGETLAVAEGYAALNGNLCRCTGYMGQKRGIEALHDRFADQLLACDDRLQYLVAQQVLPDYLASDSLLSRSEFSEETDNSSSSPVFGGGTDLLLELPLNDVVSHYRPVTIDQPVIKVSTDRIALSALHSIEAVSQSLAAQHLLPGFQPFTHWFASPPLRALATLGGNLAHASPVGDGLCFFMALDAIVETEQREIPIAEFFLGFRKTVLNPGEVIRWISVPAQCTRDTVLFEKVSRRKTTDIAAVNCTGRWTVGNGKVEAVSLALGGATVTPNRLTALEAKLRGCSLAQTIDDVLSDMVLPISPVSDHRGSAEYRRALARQLLLSQWDHIQRLHLSAPESAPIPNPTPAP